MVSRRDQKELELVCSLIGMTKLRLFECKDKGEFRVQAGVN